MLMILALIFFLMVTIVTSVRLSPNHLSTFELRRLAENNHKSAEKELRRRKLLPYLRGVQRAIEAALLMAIALSILIDTSLLIAIIGTLVVACLYRPLARRRIIQRVIEARFRRIEPTLLDSIEKSQRWLKLFREPLAPQATHMPASLEELAHIIDGSHALLEPSTRQSLAGALHFTEKRVQDAMTPRRLIEAIGKNELLGPLVLDGLHKTGHSHFPVFEGDLDRVVGMLDIRSVAATKHHHSQTAEQAMHETVYYIFEQDLLDTALKRCISARERLLIVVNDRQETVGVITIEDIVGQLYGQSLKVSSTHASTPSGALAVHSKSH